MARRTGDPLRRACPGVCQRKRQHLGRKMLERLGHRFGFRRARLRVAALDVLANLDLLDGLGCAVRHLHQRSRHEAVGLANRIKYGRGDCFALRSRDSRRRSPGQPASDEAAQWPPHHLASLAERQPHRRRRPAAHQRRLHVARLEVGNLPVNQARTQRPHRTRHEACSHYKRRVQRWLDGVEVVRILVGAVRRVPCHRNAGQRVVVARDAEGSVGVTTTV